jgi:hypothetical protein
LAPGPLGPVAGDPDRHRGWLLCPPSVPAAAGWGLRHDLSTAKRYMSAKFYRPRGAFLAPPSGCSHPTS